MNVFVLNTGRCGSTTFIRACAHISNYSSAHESRCALLGKARLDYPSGHIEADNRLSWFLGKLDERYGNDAFYVHLKRNPEITAASYVKRYSAGIINAYRKAVLLYLPENSSPMAVAMDYCETVDANIAFFLKDKTHKMDFHLENAKADFRKFWDFIGAEGNPQAALNEFEVSYNPSIDENLAARAAAKLRRIWRQASQIGTAEISSPRG